MQDCILVTGGAGFIGSNFVLRTAAQSGTAVVNLDKLTYAGTCRTWNRCGPPRSIRLFAAMSAIANW